jgi:hypothetical protein
MDAASQISSVIPASQKLGEPPPSTVPRVLHGLQLQEATAAMSEIETGNLAALPCLQRAEQPWNQSLAMPCSPPPSTTKPQLEAGTKAGTHSQLPPANTTPEPIGETPPCSIKQAGPHSGRSLLAFDI